MRVLALAKKEFSALMREKTLLLTVLVQLLVAAFSALLATGLVSYASPEAITAVSGERVSLAVVGADWRLLSLLREEGRLNLEVYAEFSGAVDDFYSHRVDGILVVTRGEDRLSDPVKIDLYLPSNDIRGTLVAAYLKEPLERYEEVLRRERLHLLPPEIREVLGYELAFPDTDTHPGYFEFIYGVLIPLLLLAPAFIAGGLVIDLFTEEREKKTLQLLMASPVSLLQIVNAKVLVSLSVVPIQSFLWIRLLEFNGIAVEREGLLILLVSGVALVLVVSGALIAVFTGRRSTAHLLYSLLLMNFFLAGMRLGELSPFGMATSLATGGSYSPLLLLLLVVLPLPLYLVLARVCMRARKAGVAA
ncbi:MAG: ABC transporter permease [Euryarchaeota archaeon]|nr:ABC transporter permease [Euryarchaeota archaeon]